MYYVILRADNHAAFGPFATRIAAYNYLCDLADCFGKSLNEMGYVLHEIAFKQNHSYRKVEKVS